MHPLNAISSTNTFNLFHVDDKSIEITPWTFSETQTVMDILREESSKEHQKFNAEITFDEIISSLLHWRESTSTSPSRRHLGVYKALLTAYIDTGGLFSSHYRENIQIKHIAQSILEIIYGWNLSKKMRRCNCDYDI